MYNHIFVFFFFFFFFWGEGDSTLSYLFYFAFNSVFLSEFLIETMYVEFLCVTIFMLKILM